MRFCDVVRESTGFSTFPYYPLCGYQIVMSHILHEGDCCLNVSGQQGTDRNQSAPEFNWHFILRRILAAGRMGYPRQ